MDWVAVLGAVGSAAVVVTGALGIWWLRIMSRRSQLLIDQKTAEAKINRDSATAERKLKKDTIEELYAILDVQRKDREDDRAIIHDLRGRVERAERRIAICEYEREVFRMRSEDQESALSKAGIPVYYRKPPTVIEMLREEKERGEAANE